MGDGGALATLATLPGPEKMEFILPNARWLPRDVPPNESQWRDPGGSQAGSLHEDAG